VIRAGREAAFTLNTGLVVRATDGDGKLQISEYRDQVPDGATGLHRVRAIVEKA
jgi:hypothetical protein